MLSKFAVSPSNVAKIISWKKHACVILSLDIKEGRIGMAMAKWPNTEERISAETAEICTLLEPNIQHHQQQQHLLLRTSKQRIKNQSSSARSNTISSVTQTIQNYNANAIIVGWPLLSDGRRGIRCGKVLHFLDLLTAQTNPPFSPKCPFTLWEIPRGILPPKQNKTMQLHPPSSEEAKSVVVDGWGRCTAFSRIPHNFPKQMIYRSYDEYRPLEVSSSSSSEEQQEEHSDSTFLLETFLEAHFGSHCKRTTKMKNDIISMNSSSKDSFSDASYIESNLL